MPLNKIDGTGSFSVIFIFSSIVYDKKPTKFARLHCSKASLEFSGTFGVQKESGDYWAEDMDCSLLNLDMFRAMAFIQDANNREVSFHTSHRWIDSTKLVSPLQEPGYDEVSTHL